MANLRDLIAATGLVILPKLDSNHRLSAPLTLKFDGWSRKTIGHLFYTTSNFLHHFKAISELKLELQSRNAQFESKLAFFLFPYDLEIWRITLKSYRTPLLYDVKLSASFPNHRWIQTGVIVRKCPIWVKIVDFLVPCDLEIWQMTLKNNRAPLLCNFKLCVSFQSHRWVQTGVTVRKRSIRVKISDILSRVISKFDGWPWKKIGHLLYTTSRFVHNFNEFKLELQPGNAEFGSKSAIFFVPRDLEIWWMNWWMKSIGYLFYVTPSFVHHLVSTCEIKLELQYWNVKFGWKSAIFLSHVILKFDEWPWKTIGHLFYMYTTSSFVHHFMVINEFELKLQSGNPQFGSKLVIFVLCDLEIWQMALKTMGQSLLCNSKLCTSFHRHIWIQAELMSISVVLHIANAILPRSIFVHRYMCLYSNIHSINLYRYIYQFLYMDAAKFYNEFSGLHRDLHLLFQTTFTRVWYLTVMK